MIQALHSLEVATISIAPETDWHTTAMWTIRLTRKDGLWNFLDVARIFVRTLDSIAARTSILPSFGTAIAPNQIRLERSYARAGRSSRESIMTGAVAYKA